MIKRRTYKRDSEDAFRALHRIEDTISEMHEKIFAIMKQTATALLKTRYKGDAWFYSRRDFRWRHAFIEKGNLFIYSSDGDHLWLFSEDVDELLNCMADGDMYRFDNNDIRQKNAVERGASGCLKFAPLTIYEEDYEDTQKH